MGRETQLFIKVDDTWKEVDLFDNVTIPITLKVSDIRQFGSKTSGYSSDFEIPHTNNNAQVFGLQADIDAYESTFEFGKDYEARLLTNSLSTFCGQFRLKKVFKQYEGKNIYYIGYLYGGSKNFIDQLGNQTLIGNDDADDDLSFSEYAISGNQFTIQEVYNRLVAFANGWGLTFIDKNNKEAVAFDQTGIQEWYTNELTPYLGVIEILDKIFEKTDYHYVSEFLQGHNSSIPQLPQWADTIGQFDVLKLIYPYPNHNSQLATGSVPVTLLVSQKEEANSLFWGFDIYPTNAAIQPFIENADRTINPQTLTYSLPQNDQYQILNWQPPRSGKYIINISLPFKVGLMFAYYYFEGPVLGWQQVKFSQQYATEHAYAYPLQTDFELVAVRNGGEYVIDTQSYTWELGEGNQLSIVDHEYWGHFNTPIYSRDELADTYEVTDKEVLLSRTDVVYLRIRSYVPFTDNGTPAYYANTPELGNDTRLSGVQRVYITQQAVGTQVMSFEQVDEFAEGQDFDPTAILNPKTKKVDFFGNLLKMFNLYVEDVSGKTNYKDGSVYPENTLRIEPYEIFYNPQIMNGLSNVHDWTHKIDLATLEYRRIDDYLYNIIDFQFAHDNDYATSQYNDTYKKEWGDKAVTGIYCRADDRQTIASLLSSYICGLINDTTQVAQCPKMFSINNKGEIDTKKEYSGSIFFLWHNDMYTQQGLTPSFFRVRSSVNPNSTINITEYECADNLNDGYGNDTADLSFGYNAEYYQQFLEHQPTMNNLFNAFYKKQYDEMTAPDARAIRCKAYLTALDIATLQLSDTIVVKGNAYRVGEILQWQDEYAPCEIELIKVVP